MNRLVVAWHDFWKIRTRLLFWQVPGPASDAGILPPGVADHLLRWSLIAAGFSRRLAVREMLGFITFSPTELSAEMDKLVRLCFGVLKI